MESSVHKELELFQINSVLSAFLLRMESLQSNLRRMFQDKWCLNKEICTKSSNSTDPLPFLSILNIFQKM